MKKYIFLFYAGITFTFFLSCETNKNYSFTGRIYDLSGNTNFEGMEIVVDYMGQTESCRKHAARAAYVKVGKDGYFKGTHHGAYSCDGTLARVLKFVSPDGKYTYWGSVGSGSNTDWEADLNVSTLGIATVLVKLKNWKKGDVIYYKVGYNYNNGILNLNPVKNLTLDTNTIVIGFRSTSLIPGMKDPRVPTPYLYIGYNQSCLYNRNGEMVPKDSIALPLLVTEPKISSLSYTY